MMRDTLVQKLIRETVLTAIEYMPECRVPQNCDRFTHTLAIEAWSRTVGGSFIHRE